MNLGLQRSLGGLNSTKTITHILKTRDAFIKGADGENTILFELSISSMLGIGKFLRLKEGEENIKVVGE